MEAKLTIAQTRDLICDVHGEIEYIDSFIQRLENKESVHAYKESIKAAEILVDRLKEAELKLQQDSTIWNCDGLYETGVDRDTSVFEPSKPRQYPTNHHNHKSV